MNVPVSGMVISDRDKDYMIDAITDGEISYGKYNEKASSIIEQILGHNRKVSLCNSGSSANLLAVMAFTSPLMVKEYALHKGDKIITTALSFPTTVAPIVQAGAIPVFVDVNPDMTININSVKKAFKRYKHVRGVIATHTLGIPFDAKGLIDICDNNDAFLIEDTCDALGSLYRDNCSTTDVCGSIGTFSTFSFYPAHHFTSGEGGAISSSSSTFMTIVNSFRDWGRTCYCDPGKDNKCGNRYTCTLLDGTPYDHKYTYSHLGFNLKMTNVQAALLYSQLQRFTEFNDNRVSAFAYLSEHLEAYAYLTPKALSINYLDYIPIFGFPLKTMSADSRLTIVKELNAKGIGTRFVFAGNIIKQEVIKTIPEYYVAEELVNTDYITNNVFWIGSWHGLSREQLLYEVNTVKEVYTKNERL